MSVFFVMVLLLNTLVWHAFFSTLAYLNGGGLGRHTYLVPFQCLWEDIVMLCPGATVAQVKQRATESLSAGVDGFLSDGAKSLWYSEVVRIGDEELWQKCANEWHGSWIVRFAETVFALAFLLWPLYLLV